MCEIARETRLRWAGHVERQTGVSYNVNKEYGSEWKTKERKTNK